MILFTNFWLVLPDLDLAFDRGHIRKTLSLPVSSSEHVEMSKSASLRMRCRRRRYWRNHHGYEWHDLQTESWSLWIVIFGKGKRSAKVVNLRVSKNLRFESRTTNDAKEVSFLESLDSRQRKNNFLDCGFLLFRQNRKANCKAEQKLNMSWTIL